MFHPTSCDEYNAFEASLIFSKNNFLTTTLNFIKLCWYLQQNVKMCKCAYTKEILIP